MGYPKIAAQQWAAGRRSAAVSPVLPFQQRNQSTSQGAGWTQPNIRFQAKNFPPTLPDICHLPAALFVQPLPNCCRLYSRRRGRRCNCRCIWCIRRCRPRYSLLRTRCTSPRVQPPKPHFSQCRRTRCLLCAAGRISLLYAERQPLGQDSLARRRSQNRRCPAKPQRVAKKLSATCGYGLGSFLISFLSHPTPRFRCTPPAAAAASRPTSIFRVPAFYTGARKPGLACHSSPAVYRHCLPAEPAVVPGLHVRRPQTRSPGSSLILPAPSALRLRLSPICGLAARQLRLSRAAAQS